MSDNFLNGLLGGLGKDGNNLLLLILLLFFFSNGNILGDLFGQSEPEPEPPGRRRPY